MQNIQWSNFYIDVGEIDLCSRRGRAFLKNDFFLHKTVDESEVIGWHIDFLFQSQPVLLGTLSDVCDDLNFYENFSETNICFCEFT